MKIGIVSTFSDRGYEEYAKYFIASLEKYLDNDVEVFLYVDNTSAVTKPNIHILNLEKSVSELTDFKSRNKNKTFKNFLWDAVRFSHKSYAIWHAAAHSDVDILIWLDADTELINNVSKQFLKNFLPEGYFTSYLGRDS